MLFYPSNANKTDKQNDQLTARFDKFSSRENTWPREIIKPFKNRSPPVYSTKDIIIINNSFLSDIKAVNKIKQQRLDELHKQIEQLRNQQTCMRERLPRKAVHPQVQL